MTRTFTPRPIIEEVTARPAARGTAVADPCAGTGSFTIPHEGAPLTVAPDAARTASPQRAGRVQKVGKQWAEEGVYEKPSPAAAMLLIPLIAFIVAGTVATVVAG